MVAAAFLLLLLVLIGTAWAGRQWIGDQLAAQANARLEEAGVYLTWEDANWVPGPGVKLSNVTLFRDAERTDPAIKVSHVSLVKDTPGWRDWSSGRFKTKRARLILISGETQMPVEAFSIDLQVAQGRVKLDQAGGLMEGWAALITGEYAWTPRSELSPEEQAATPPREKGQALQSALRFGWLAPTQRHIKVVSTNQPPLAHLDFRKGLPEDRVKMNLEIKGGDFTWRGIHFTEASAKLDTAAEGDPWSRLEVPLLRLASGGGTAELAGHIDPGKREVVINKLDSTLDLPAVIRSLSPQSTHLQNLTSEGEWKMTGTGRIPFSDPASSEWEGTLGLKGRLSWTMAAGTIQASNVQSRVHVKDRLARLHEVEAELWGGRFSTGELVLDYSTPATTFQTNARLTGASLHDVMRSFGSAEPRQGDVSGIWAGGGGFSATSIKGGGSLTITQAKFYQVPFLGALHVLINPLQPEIGPDVASRLDAQYRIAEGTLTFSQLDLSSNATKVNASGRIHLESKQAHFAAQARLRGLVLRLATGAVTELLTFEGAGVLPDLRWQLKLAHGSEIVKGTLNAAGDVLLEGAKLGVEGAKKGAQAAEGVLEGTGKAAREIFKLPGRLIPGGRK